MSARDFKVQISIANFIDFRKIHALKYFDHGWRHNWWRRSWQHAHDIVAPPAPRRGFNSSFQSISAAITSWKDFRTIAPTYFFMGMHFRSICECLSTLSIDLSVSKSSQTRHIRRIFGNIAYFHWFILDFTGFHWISLISIDFIELQLILGWTSRH